jgi:hypothetical protein
VAGRRRVDKRRCLSTAASWSCWSRQPLRWSTVTTAAGVRDCQEWEWLPRRFDPQRALGTPGGIAAILGPNRRIDRRRGLGDAVMGRAQPRRRGLPATKVGPFYPIELVRAVTLS